MEKSDSMNILILSVHKICRAEERWVMTMEE